MRAWTYAAVICVAVALLAAPASADPTIFGPSGFIRVPDAQTLPAGSLEASAHYAEDVATTANMCVGVTNRLEIAPAWIDPEHDTSSTVISAKLEIAQDRYENLRVAAGIFDLGDEYNRTLFGVAQRDLTLGNTPCKVVAGWGEHNSLVDGFFGGAQFFLGKGYSVFVEYDGNDVNAALRWPINDKYVVSAGVVSDGLYVGGMYKLR